MYYFTEMSYYNIKKSIHPIKQRYKALEINNKYISREPKYSDDIKRIYYLNMNAKTKLIHQNTNQAEKKISSFAEDVFILLQVLHQCNLILQAYVWGAKLQKLNLNKATLNMKI